MHGQYASRIQPDVLLFQISEAAQQKGCAGKENHGDGNLPRHQATAQECVLAGSSKSSLKCGRMRFVQHR